MYTRVFVTCLAAAAFWSPSVSAQDTTLDATYETIAFDTGFTPDPFTFAVAAGGDIEVVDGDCFGYVAAAPDVELTFTGGSLPLNIYVVSDADTMLMINGPDGSWTCNDDTSGLNPAVSFNPAATGVYDIWVGTLEPDTYPGATLHVSELDPQW